MLDRLVDAGPDVKHVDTVVALGKGTSDTDLAAYSRDTERTIVTYWDIQRLRSLNTSMPNLGK